MRGGDSCQSFTAASYSDDRGGKAEIRFHRFMEADVLAGRIVSPRGKLGILVSRAMASSRNLGKDK